ncbi:protoglobin domain-containing protein [Desulfurobacterium atlanticum]|uniref:Phosphate-starvation-inducible E n=1 Tax=Desulfurobacterium atlanticum TaxID=240169 RepID=A0A238ZFZ3_9BACT|nr:protoglobin domain-containing protein [Desulfurobacterium atlanticum]SNR81623.1 Phosphate-starvation-inducible E [Desulfurobacterium atlanticum]
MGVYVSYSDIEKLLYQLELREKDFNNLKEIGKYLLEYKEEFADAFLNQLMRCEEATKFISEEEYNRRVRREVIHWYEMLFTGKYDSEYLTYILKIARVHAEAGIPPNLIVAMMNFVRRFCTKRIVSVVSEKMGKDCSGVEEHIRSFSKLLDLHLSVMLSFYIDHEMRTFIDADPAEKFVIRFSKKFAFVMDVAIILGLMVVGMVVVGLFVQDVMHLFSGDLTHGLIAALGDLLILWTVLELLNSEIKFMMGGELAVSAFVSVALAATIREALVLSLQHDKPIDFKLGIGALIFILGIVYGIVKWYEYKRGEL